MRSYDSRAVASLCPIFASHSMVRMQIHYLHRPVTYGHLSLSLSLSRLLLRLRERLRSAWREPRSLRESRSRSTAFLSFRLSPASASALRPRFRSE